MSTILNTLKKLEEEKSVLEKNINLKGLLLQGQESTYPQFGRQAPRRWGLLGGLAAGGVLFAANMYSPKASKEVGQDVQKFKEVLTQINTEYVDEVVTTEMVDGAIQYLLNKLDPHSAYIPARDRIMANEDLRGNFEGIGIEFNIFQIY